MQHPHLFVFPQPNSSFTPPGPLQDNLESATYEVFEKDIIKYVQYEEAVFRALGDKKASSGGKVRHGRGWCLFERQCV